MDVYAEAVKGGRMTVIKIAIAVFLVFALFVLAVLGIGVLTASDADRISEERRWRDE